MKKVKINSYAHHVALLCTAALFVIASFWVAKASGDGLWFARSGSIMVLLAVVVSYRIAKLQQESNSDAMIVSGLGIPISGDLSKAEQNLSKCAHAFAVIGTIIWGYGDLII